ncbi:glycoside hydrolase family 43 protein [Enterococcus gallinarum]|uniref:glycoside hydrolase family 43 protein n=1 Tax=Enterococcus gallinarum TaxID=1353 RepID=UPI0024339194|nr:glycoside hydrolase family 43 protein [Enterococcus gallinarum]
MTKRTIKNPILPGFHPDPSICRVGADFYLVTSTFEYFPGLPIYHSRNLIDWTLIGHGINRSQQLRLSTKQPNALGLYAPTIRYINERFYIVCTNVGDNGAQEGNFLIWTDDILGEWSQPIWLDTPGIDPTIFEDDDGQCYYLGTHKEIYLRKVDLTGGKLGKQRNIWTGSGAADPEGPHLYKKNGYYYLLISEGGTSYGHMLTMARSRHIEGPYEACTTNPVMSNRSTSLPLQAAGHADLVQDTAGKWWAVCLAVRPISYPLRHLLGRETCLLPVDWSATWPVFGDEGHLPETLVIETESSQSVPAYREWVTLFEWDPSLIQLTESGFLLQPNANSLPDQKKMAIVLQRQTALKQNFQADFDCQNLTDGEAGMTVFLNATHHYEIALKTSPQGNHILLRRQIGSLWKVENSVPYEENRIRLFIEGSNRHYRFSYLDDRQNKHLLGSGETSYLTTEVGGVFTGVMMGVYAASDIPQQQVQVSIE